MLHTIKQVEEKNSAQELEILLWSDRMDLVALSNVKGEVALHRLTWTRAWTLGPIKDGYKVKDLAWRPDGKVLAVGYNSGDILLVNVENKSTLFSLKIFGDITCISWTHEKHEEKSANIFSKTVDEDKIYLKNADASSSFLPDPPTATNFDSNSADDNVKSNFFQKQTDLNVLLIGTKEGIIYLSIFGCIPVSVINLNTYLGFNCEIIQVHLSTDLKTMFAVIKNKDDCLDVIVFIIDIFQTHKQELFSMALKYQELNSLLNYLSTTITTIKESWENILLEMDSKLSKYASKVPDGIVSADFLDLLMFGVSSDEMQEFLLRDLTKKGLEKFGQTIEMSYATIQKLLLKNITKIGPNITYHLAELLGMARLEHRYKKVGLDEDNILKAIASNGSFLSKGGEIQQIINDSMINYKAFFRWLYMAIMHLMEERVAPEILKMTQQDLVCITEFLKNFDSITAKNNVSVDGNQETGFIMERLGQYLADSDLTMPLRTDKNEWNCFLMDNNCIKDHPSVIKHNKDHSLIQQHNELVKSIETIFEKPTLLISEQFQMFKIIKALECSSNVSISLINYDSQITFMAFLSNKSPSDGIYIIELNYLDEFFTKAIYIYFEQEQKSFSKNLLVQDIKFYSPNILSVLLQERDTKISILYQFPTLLVRDQMIKINTDINLNVQNLNKINGCTIGNISMKYIDGMVCSKLAVSGSRKVSVVLSENRRKVRLFEMEADEDEEEDADITNSLRESDTTM